MSVDRRISGRPSPVTSFPKEEAPLEEGLLDGLRTSGSSLRRGNLTEHTCYQLLHPPRIPK
jgi:hypothetical protein